LSPFKDSVEDFQVS